jgi:hypothetical protein
VFLFLLTTALHGAQLEEERRYQGNAETDVDWRRIKDPRRSS